MAYAHTHPDFPADPTKWEPLFTPFGNEPNQCQRETCEKCHNLAPYHGHLNKVAYWTAKFASDMFPANSPEAQSAWDWGYLAGLWHDLGKFAPKWQKYLQAKVDIHTDEVNATIDHSTAGAKYAVRKINLLGHLLAYPIAGHHTGLLDAIPPDQNCKSSQKARLSKEIEDWESHAPESCLHSTTLPPHPSFANGNPFSSSFFTKALFSCLVDADFLATESFMSSAKTEKRNQISPDILRKISELVEAKIDSYPTPKPEDIVNVQRRMVVENCREASTHPPGLFTLSVPTGGGKTLSSLDFALRHALNHGQKRIIYVAPFTSIIEQNADVIREIISPLENDTQTILLEHHSSIDPNKESDSSMLAAENWDAPLIVTTAVQFFESLFAAKTSRARKIHNIANSVIILDEAQSLPLEFLSPCLRVIQELADSYNCTLILCTATQPAIGYDQTEFPIGLKGLREIIQNPIELFNSLKRVKIENIRSTTDESLTDKLTQHEQVLCIVNLRKHAQHLFTLLPKSEANYHLSALMCPAHRREKLQIIRKKLESQESVRVISTQLIEAGIDVDFPFVYRAHAGLDSVAQAAGRCNRHGKREIGNVFLFENQLQEGNLFKSAAQVTRQLLTIHDDLLSQNAIRHYFENFYWEKKSKLDDKEILQSFALQQNKDFPFVFDFATVAKNFQLISDAQIPVIIPWNQEAKDLITDLKNSFKPLNRKLLRKLQQYTVQIHPQVFAAQSPHAIESIRENQFFALISTQFHYSEDFGLTFSEEYATKQDCQC